MVSPNTVEQGPEATVDVFAATRVVDPSGLNGTDTTIASAISNLPAAGGVIYLREGTYAQAAVLSMPVGKDVKIIGSGIGNTIVSRGSSDPLFEITSDDSYEFAGMTLRTAVGAGGNIFEFGTGASGSNPIRVSDILVDDGQVLLASAGTGVVAASLRNCDVTLGTGSTVRLISSNAGGFCEAVDCVFTEGGNAGAGGIVGDPEIRWTNVRYGPGANATMAAGKTTMTNCDTTGGQWEISGARSKLSNCEFDSESGTGGSNVVLESTADQSVITGCIFRNATTQNVLVDEATGCRITGNEGCLVTETGAADENIYLDIDPGSTIIGTASITETWGVRIVTTTPVTLDREDRTILVDATVGDITVNIPDPADARYQEYTIKKVDVSTNIVIITPGVGTIEGAADFRVTTRLDAVKIQAVDAVQWLVISNQIGLSYQSALTSVRSTTTSATFQAKTTLTTPALRGTFKLSWHALVDNNEDFGEFRLQNTTDGVTVGATQVYQAGNSANREDVDGVGEVAFTGAAKTFEIQFRAQVAGDTQGIQDARIEISRVL